MQKTSKSQHLAAVTMHAARHFSYRMKLLARNRPHFDNVNFTLWNIYIEDQYLLEGEIMFPGI